MNDKRPRDSLEDKFFRECFEKTPTPSYIWRKQGNDLILINYNIEADEIVNNQMEKFLGIKASELYKDNPEILEDLNNCLDGKVIPPKEIDYHYQSINLSKRLMCSYIYIPPDVVFVHTDIIIIEEEWKTAEQKLRESEERYRNLFENSPYIIALLDIEGKILEVNSIIKELTGYDKAFFIGRNYLELHLYNESLIPNLKKRLKLLKKGEQIEPIEVLFEAKEGRKICLLSHMSKLSLSDEEFILVVVLDITEKKNAEIKLKESELKYREAYNRAEFYKDLFAHDINNILQNIRSANELRQILRNDINKEERLAEVNEIINTQVMRGANLVSNIRKSSLLEEFSKKIKPIQFNLLLESAITFIEKMFQERDIRIRVHPFNANLVVFGNEFILDVFENILINAVKYNQSPIIRIDIDIKKITNKEVNFVQFQFMDNGIGIKDQRKEKIFQRGEDKFNIEGGMGLGLSLVKKILESYKGIIWVENRIEGDYTQGSNFKIIIPEAIETD